MLLAASAASAQDLPCSPLRLVVPYPAGGATDVAARLIAERLEPALKKTVVIENRAGATGNIGTVAVVQSAPDGCTLLVNAASIATFTVSFSRPGYDALKDLVPVGGIGRHANHAGDRHRQSAERSEDPDRMGQEQAGRPDAEQAGYGLIQHLAAEEIGRRSGDQAHPHSLSRRRAGDDRPRHRPGRPRQFRCGHHAAVDQRETTQGGRGDPPKRSALIPDVPTTDEQGLTGINSNVQFMVLAPAATPKPVIDRLSAELRKVVGDPALKDRFAAIGFEPTPSSSEEMAAIMRKTAEDWVPVIRQLNIKMD